MCQSSQWSCIALMCKVRENQHPWMVWSVVAASAWCAAAAAWSLARRAVPYWKDSSREYLVTLNVWYWRGWVEGWFSVLLANGTTHTRCPCVMQLFSSESACLSCCSLSEYFRFISLGTIPLWGFKGNLYHMNGDNSVFYLENNSAVFLLTLTILFFQH